MNDYELKQAYEVIKTLQDYTGEVIIDIAEVQEKHRMKERQKYLAMHPWKPWYREDKEKWYVYMPDADKKKVRRERKTLKEIEDLIVEYWQEQEENPTIKEVFYEWLNRRLQLNTIKKSTYDRYKQTYDRHYKKFGNRRIKSVSPQEISDFLEEEIADKGLSAKAFGNLKSITKEFLKRAKKRKLITYNVMELFNELDVSDVNFKRKHKKDSEEVFTDEEYPVIMNYLTENPDMYNLGFLLMFVTGLRSGELVALKWDDYDGISLNVCRSETRHTDEAGKLVYEVSEPKTEAGYRTVVIPRDYIWIMERLRAINPFTEYIFSERGERVRAYCFRNRFKTVCKNTGCVEKSLHKIRKTYGSILLDNNVDNRLIIGQMGHTNIVCTENYYHRNRRNLENKQQIISRIAEFKI